MKYKTLVLFRRWVDQGTLQARIEVDSALTCEWPHEKDFLNAVEAARDLQMDAESIKRITDMKFQEQPLTEGQKTMCRAAQLMALRARANGNDMDGPFVLNSDFEPDDAQLKAWYSESRKKKAAVGAKRKASAV